MARTSLYLPGLHSPKVGGAPCLPWLVLIYIRSVPPSALLLPPVQLARVPFLLVHVPPNRRAGSLPSIERGKIAASLFSFPVATMTPLFLS